MSTATVLGVEGEARAILDEAGGGLAITPESAEELAVAVLRLADNPTFTEALGARGYAHVREHYDRTRLARRYLELLEKVVAGRISPPPSAERRTHVLEDESE